MLLITYSTLLNKIIMSLQSQIRCMDWRNFIDYLGGGVEFIKLRPTSMVNSLGEYIPPPPPPYEAL